MGVALIEGETFFTINEVSMRIIYLYLFERLGTLLGVGVALVFNGGSFS